MFPKIKNCSQMAKPVYRHKWDDDDGDDEGGKESGAKPASRAVAVRSSALQLQQPRQPSEPHPHDMGERQQQQDELDYLVETLNAKHSTRVRSLRFVL